VIFPSGDDADAKSEVRSLFDNAGFAVIDLGACAQAARCSRSAVRSPA
jgi:predicted dinucleotide-binding enzyme